MPERVTIEDISRHTGLSRGTVSRALSDRPDISDATKRRVLEMCRRLNYVPSRAARLLATGREEWDNFRLSLRVHVDENAPTEGVVDELIRLYQALNKYHRAAGGHGLTIDDWKHFVEALEPMEVG